MSVIFDILNLHRMKKKKKRKKKQETKMLDQKLIRKRDPQIPFQPLNQQKSS